jgi:outer membrane protein
MKRLFGLIIFIAAIFILQHNALAQEPLKIGILDIQRCINNSNEGRRIFTSLKNRQSTMQAELNKKQEELLEMQKEIEKQSLMLSLDAQEDKQKEYDKKRRELEYLVQDLNEELSKAETEARQEILNSLEVIIEKIGREENYDLILERVTSGSVFASEALDITDRVIDEFNRAKP